TVCSPEGSDTEDGVLPTNLPSTSMSAPSGLEVIASSVAPDWVITAVCSCGPALFCCFSDTGVAGDSAVVTAALLRPCAAKSATIMLQASLAAVATERTAEDIKTSPLWLETMIWEFLEKMPFLAFDSRFRLAT